MIQAKYIQKFRNKQNQIYGYRLQDSQGNTKDVTPQQLKQVIQNNQINIINLTLTSDNRLIDITPTTQPKQNPPKIQYALLTREIIKQVNKPKALSFKSNQNLEALESKATLLGNQTKTLSEDFLLLESDSLITLVSNKQIQLDNTKQEKDLFEKTVFTSIDFHNTDTSNVTNMFRMFYDCQAQTLDLSNFDTSNVTYIGSIFLGCQAQIKATDPKLLRFVL